MMSVAWTCNMHCFGTALTAHLHKKAQQQQTMNQYCRCSGSERSVLHGLGELNGRQRKEGRVQRVWEKVEA